MSDFVTKPCQHCPYRRDVKPFLTPERGEELAYLAENPYNSFTCHKTLENDEETGKNYSGVQSKVCAGFLSLQHNVNGHTSYDEEGFKPSPDVYDDTWDMVEAYSEGANG